MLFKQSSQQIEEWSSHHFDKHTASLFTQNKSLIKKKLTP